MNIQATIRRPRPVKLTGDGFWALRQAGAFRGYAKSELIDGEISGVPLQTDDEPESDASVPIKLRIEDYALLAAGGYLDTLGKTELIDGLVYAVSPQYRQHGFIKDELAYRLRRKLEEIGSAVHVATEQSVAIRPYDEPQPDIVLTSEPRGEGPIPVTSVALMVEISWSTLDIDLQSKARLYASASVPEYWVVDVNARVIHQLWSPADDSYTERHEVAFGERLLAATIPVLEIDTAEL